MRHLNTLPVQPEYRALMMYDTLPAGCIAVQCTDNYSYPHIRPGEHVVVDTADRAPRHLELYVIEWSNGRRVICQARNTGRKAKDRPDEMLWSVGSLQAVRGRAAIESYLDRIAAETPGGGIPVIRGLGWAEGWWIADGLAKKLVGCVVGLYASGFEEPRKSRP